MFRALILVKCSYGASVAISSEAKKVLGVTDCYPVFGRYDVVIFVEGEDYRAVKAIADKISGLEGVRSTETLPEGD